MARSITRRSFLKKSAATALGIAIGPTIIIEALGHTGDTVHIKAVPGRAIKPDDTIAIFQKEVSRVSPTLGKRLDKLEILANPDEFGVILRGFVRTSRTKGKSFGFALVKDKFLNNLEFRRKVAKDFVMVMENG